MGSSFFLVLSATVLVCYYVCHVQGQSLTNGDLRLVNNNGLSGVTTGRLEVYYNFQWGTVCDDGFGATEARVACRQLGFSDYVQYDSVGDLGLNQPSSTTPIWLDDVDCVGTESRLSSCSSRGIGSHNCGHNEDVGLQCLVFSPVAGDLRLVNNNGLSGVSFGRLEVYYNSQWGTVCDDFFGVTEARVACRQLGFSDYTQYDKVGDLGLNQPLSTAPIWLDDVNCVGTESRLSSCSNGGIGSHNCGHSEDVGLQCFATVTTAVAGLSNGDLRLVDNNGVSGVSFGRLEVYYNSEWGTVCDDEFFGLEARVACRQLGFSNYARYDRVGDLGLNQPLSTTPIWLDDVDCVGTESRLSSCSSRGIGSHNCGHSEDVGLQCTSSVTTVPTPTTTDPTEGDIRLIGVSGLTGGMAGRVEVYHNNQWSTVCPTSLTKQADVICRQLGFSESVYNGTVNVLGYSGGSSSTILSSGSCSGFESRLRFCSGFGVTSSCSHSSDLAVVCGGSYSSTAAVQSGALRLNTDGASNPRSFSGRLEIYISGQWGTVCDDSFGGTDANTACRQLGFLSALFYGNVGTIGFSQGSGRIWLDDLTCSSGDSTLLECSHRGIGSHNCDHREDVALVCLGVGSLRLVGAPSSTSVSRSSGRLEVYADGGWGTVCDDRFGSTEANVACRQLGFQRATDHDDVSSSSRYSTSLPILLDDLQCSESDNFLLRCSHRGIGSHNCGHSEDIELSCSTDTVNVGLAVGLGVGIPVVVAVIVFASCWYYHRKKKRTPRRTPAVSTTRRTTPTIRTSTVIASSPPQNTAYPLQSSSIAFQSTNSNQPGNPYSTLQYASPYPPAPYPTAPQQLPTPYPTSQPPPAPYLSGQPASETFPMKGQSGKSDLYSEAPPAYSEVANYPSPVYPANNPYPYISSQL